MSAALESGSPVEGGDPDRRMGVEQFARALEHVPDRRLGRIVVEAGGPEHVARPRQPLGLDRERAGGLERRHPIGDGGRIIDTQRPACITAASDRMAG